METFFFIILVLVVIFFADGIKKQEKQNLEELERKTQELKGKLEYEKMLEEKKQEEAQLLAELEQKRQSEKAENEAREIEYKNEQIKKFAELVNSISVIDVNISENLIEHLDVDDMPELKPSAIRKGMLAENFCDFVVIDTETTGFSPKRNKILELTAIRFIDFKPIEYMTTLVNSKTKIKENITAINGITNEMLADKPVIEAVAQSFIDFIGKEKIIVGHNVEFDLKFLYANGINLFDIKRKYIDTVELASKTLKKIDTRRFNIEYEKERERDDYFSSYTYDVDNYKLQTLLHYCHIYTPEAHRSFYDALATGQLFYKLLFMKIG